MCDYSIAGTSKRDVNLKKFTMEALRDDEEIPHVFDTFDLYLRMNFAYNAICNHISLFIVCCIFFV